MREIKFRAWHEANKKFEYVTIKDIWKNGWQCCEGTRQLGETDEINQIKTKQHGIFTTQECLDGFANKSFIPMAEWKQYTGLKDKNGKEIYEGDVVVDWNTGMKNEYSAPVVVWLNDYKLMNHLQPDQFCILEIIGNIYENPELLKEEKNGL